MCGKQYATFADRLGDVDFWKCAGKWTGWVVIAPLVLLLLFRVLFVNFVDNYELGYKYDLRSGKTAVLSRTGYFVTLPFVVSVHHIDLRPMQVCISAIQRVLNCKLVQFNPTEEGVQLFLLWHGRQNYDGPDTTTHSTNGAVARETYFQSVLKNYAYDGSGKAYPFLTVLRELKPEEKATP